jgi:hypothetical protein
MWSKTLGRHSRFSPLLLEEIFVNSWVSTWVFFKLRIFPIVNCVGPYLFVWVAINLLFVKKKQKKSIKECIASLIQPARKQLLDKRQPETLSN